MDHLFNRLEGLYPRQWRSGFANKQSIDNWRTEWAAGFEADHVTPADVKIAVDACRKIGGWPPSSYADFVKLFRPTIEPESAFYVAVEQMHLRRSGADKWPSIELYWAAIRLGGELSSQPYASVKTRWAQALKFASDGLKNGTLPAEIPERRLALAASVPVPTDVARQRVEEIKRQLQGMMVSS